MLSQLIGRLFPAIHTAIYRLSRGRLLGKFSGAPVLLLITTGRKTGKRRTIPLLYLSDDDAYVVVASAGGGPRHPAWYHNLEANPQVTIQLKSRRVAVTATTASPEERARLWPAITSLYSGYDDYQKRTEREIPLVIIREPSADGSV